jgi:glycerol-3-phosphate dehydrogenase
MWQSGWRDQVWAKLDQQWDLIVIGGGITGAGILREATRAGLKTLLVEGNDFSSGTSSRSSKLVHGGFRYLKNGQVKLTLISVRERERLLREGRGLIVPLGFLMANFRTDRLPAWLFGVGLTVYDILALKWGHRYYDSTGIQELCPQLNDREILGGYRYFDAETDDARLVLRVIREAVRQGGVALNYARVDGLIFSQTGQVCGVQLKDLDPEAGGRTAEARSCVVINATGAWADELRMLALKNNITRGGQLSPKLRHLRGSHLIFPESKLPLSRAVCLWHPTDGRPVFAFPWEGVTILGTTDIDHGYDALTDPKISLAEAEYLLAVANYAFPCLNLALGDVQGTFSGIRAVLDTGKGDPSKESREHVLWNENGFITVTGGKLTTFRIMAHDTLRAARTLLPGQPVFNPHFRVLDTPPTDIIGGAPLEGSARLRLLGRYGADTPEIIAASQTGELQTISSSSVLWAELRWAARAEGVIHLDDLLLRRVRLGLLLPQGGIPCLDSFRRVVQAELRWNDLRWEQEVENYINLWKRSYSLHCLTT